MCRQNTNLIFPVVYKYLMNATNITTEYFNQLNKLITLINSDVSICNAPLHQRNPCRHYPQHVCKPPQTSFNLLKYLSQCTVVKYQTLAVGVSRSACQGWHRPVAISANIKLDMDTLGGPTHRHNSYLVPCLSTQCTMDDRDTPPPLPCLMPLPPLTKCWLHSQLGANGNMQYCYSVN